MRMLFDTSALFKRYSREGGSDHVDRLSAQASEFLVAAHCKVEIASAINRLRHDGQVTAGHYAELMGDVHADFDNFSLLPLDVRIEALAIAAMERSRLRAMDALHIASAQAAKVDLFVTADRRQAQAAQAVGLATELIDA